MSNFVFLYLESRLSTRCYACRSRGDLGDCRDPFSFNDTSIKELPGTPVSVTPCPSGWCRKQTEGIRGPADGNNKEIYIYIFIYALLYNLIFGRELHFNCAQIVGPIIIWDYKWV